MNVEIKSNSRYLVEYNIQMHFWGPVGSPGPECVLGCRGDLTRAGLHCCEYRCLGQFTGGVCAAASVVAVSAVAVATLPEPCALLRGPSEAP